MMNTYTLTFLQHIGKIQHKAGGFNSGCTSEAYGEDFKFKYHHTRDADLIDLIVLGHGPDIGIFETLPG